MSKFTKFYLKHTFDAAICAMMMNSVYETYKNRNKDFHYTFHKIFESNLKLGLFSILWPVTVPMTGILVVHDAPQIVKRIKEKFT